MISLPEKERLTTFLCHQVIRNRSFKSFRKHPKSPEEPAHLGKPAVRGTGCSASGRVPGMETGPALNKFGGVYQDDPARTLLPSSLATPQERLGVNLPFPLSC